MISIGVLPSSAILLFSAWATLGVLSFIANRDLLSPAKFFHLNLGVYFATLFVKKYPIDVDGIYVGMLALSGFIIIWEWVGASRVTRSTGRAWMSFAVRSRDTSTEMPNAVWLIWICTLAPVLSLGYLIISSGGLLAYLVKTTLLIQEFQGMGAFLASMKLIVPINGLYWIILLLRRDISKSSRFLFSLHFILVIFIALMTGSRGTILTSFVVLIVTYHLLRRPVSAHIIAMAALSLLIVAGVLGTLRNNYSATDDGLTIKATDADDYLEANFADYGVIPLDLVMGNPTVPRAWGSTFVSAMTNLVPRAIWPGKPESGGVYLTERYADNRWEGNSYLSTGIIAEGIINFGYGLGIVFGFAMFIFAYILFLRLYPFPQYLHEADNAASLILRTFLVVNITILLPNLQFGEFTNLTVTFVLRLMLAIGFLLTYRILFGVKEGRREEYRV